MAAHSDTLRLAMLRAAMAALEAAEQSADGPASEEVADSRWRVRIEITPAQQELPGNANRLSAGNRLTALDRRILAAATREEQSMPRLAHRANHDNDSYFRSRVKRLVEAGHLVTEFGGYRLP